MDNEVNIEENNLVTNKVNKNRTIYVIITIVLCIMCLGVGYIIGSSKHIDSKEEVELNNNDKTGKQEETIEEQAEEKEAEKQEEEQEETTKSTITTSNNMNSIKADIGKDEKITENIVLNGKTLELTYELENYDENWG